MVTSLSAGLCGMCGIPCFCFEGLRVRLGGVSVCSTGLTHVRDIRRLFPSDFLVVVVKGPSACPSYLALQSLTCITTYNITITGFKAVIQLLQCFVCDDGPIVFYVGYNDIIVKSCRLPLCASYLYGGRCE